MYSCNHLDRIEDMKGIGESKLEILSLKSDSEAEAILRQVPLEDVFQDYENKECIYAKGIFKIPLLDRVDYRYFPAFFYIDCIGCELYNIIFLKSNVPDELKKLYWRSNLDNYSSFLKMCFLVTDMDSTIERNFSP
jgi:hypothetical protein